MQWLYQALGLLIIFVTGTSTMVLWTSDEEHKAIHVSFKWVIACMWLAVTGYILKHWGGTYAPCQDFFC